MKNSRFDYSHLSPELRKLLKEKLKAKLKKEFNKNFIKTNPNKK